MSFKDHLFTSRKVSILQHGCHPCETGDVRGVGCYGTEAHSWGGSLTTRGLVRWAGQPPIAQQDGSLFSKQ